MTNPNTLLAELDKYLVRCPNPNNVSKWPVKKSSRLLWQCREVIQALDTPQPAPVVDVDALLPCDVKVEPATVITAGCKLSTLLNCIELRRSSAGMFESVDYAELNAALAAQPASDRLASDSETNAAASRLIEYLLEAGYPDDGDAIGCVRVLADRLAQLEDHAEKALALANDRRWRYVRTVGRLPTKTVAGYRYEDGVDYATPEAAIDAAIAASEGVDRGK